jgi:hypothetical protein
MKDFFIPILTSLHTHPLTIFILLALFGHASFVAINSYLRYRQDKKKVTELAETLKESEIRVQKLLYSMDQNRHELIESMESMNNILIKEIDEKTNMQKPPEPNE